MRPLLILFAVFFFVGFAVQYDHFRDLLDLFLVGAVVGAVFLAGYWCRISQRTTATVDLSASTWTAPPVTLYGNNTRPDLN